MFKTFHNTALKLIFCVVLVGILTVSVIIAQAANTETTITDLAVTPNNRNLQDGNTNTFSTVNSLTLKSNTPIDSIYIIFNNTIPNYTLTCGENSVSIKNSFLHAFEKIPEKLSECYELTVTFDKQIQVSDVYAFAEGELPAWVQTWQQPYDKADLMLCTTHADDEQLFFAGILPYHTAKDYRVQVVYFTDHTNTPSRRHELLNGLWTVGVEHYPVINCFPDAYATSYNGALSNLKNAGYSEDDAIAFQVEMLRRFNPQVVVSHDLKGEYGHGQHMLNAETLIKATELAANIENYPDSANTYGVWETPKLYLHLYGENKITLNWDEPLEKFGGKTAFQMSQAGYEHHKSQHYTWFTDWLRGYNNEISKASQIKTYSPCEYGLYRTTVGEDVEKNSFFENIISYDEQIRIELERLEQERLEKERLEREEQQRKEEESRRLESERLESIRIESEAESSRISASEKAAQEKHRLEIEKQQKQARIYGTVGIIVLVASVAALSVVVFKKSRRF